MTVEELKSDKMELERQIVSLLDSFYEKYNIPLTGDIRVVTDTIKQGNPEVARFFCMLKLEV